MKKSIFILLLSLLYYADLQAQQRIQFAGKVFSADSIQPLSRASLLLRKDDHIIGFAFTDMQGVYSFDAVISDSGSYFLEVKLLNYETERIALFLPESPAQAYNNNFFLLPSIKPLDEIVVKSVWKAQIKNDTIEYNAAAYQTKETRKVEDLLKNIDGFSISSEGIIAYRGKEVKALLIDGDDLTQDQYVLLSKNLSAEIVDKVQIIDNYSRNRILGSIIKSGDAAVNLKLKKKLQGKVTGSYSLGYTTSERHEADGNLIWLKDKLKLIQLVNSNTISKNIIGNAFYAEGASGSTLNLHSFNEIKIVYTAPLTASEINIPPLPVEYTQNGKRQLILPLLHYSLSKKIKLSAKAGYFTDNRKNSSESLIETLIDDQNKWQIKSVQKAQKNNEGFATTLNFAHDNGKDFTGNFKIQASRLIKDCAFFDYTTMAITDSLLENFKSQANVVSFDYSGTTKIHDAVLFFSSFYSHVVEKSGLGIGSGRYSTFYQLPDSLHFFNQKTLSDFSTYGMESSLIQKKKTLTLKYGISTFVETVNGTNNIGAFTSASPSTKYYLPFINSVIQPVSQYHHQINFKGIYTISEKMSAYLTSKFGVGQFSKKEYRQNTSIWNLQADWVVKFRTFSNLSLSLSSVKEMPLLQWFYPDSLFIGNSAIKYATDKFQPIQYNQANFSMVLFKLRTSSSLLINAWVKKGLHDYKTRSVLNPYVSQLQYIPTRNNLGRGVLLSGKTFAYFLRSTISFSSFLQNDKEYRTINDKDALDNSTNFNYTVSLITSFKCPVNTEFSYNHSYYWGTQFKGKDILEANSKFFSLQNKYRIQFNENYYLGIQYSYMKFEKKGYHLSSIFGSYSFSKKLSLDIKVHNLFNVNSFTRIDVGSNFEQYQSFENVHRYILLRINYSL